MSRQDNIGDPNWFADEEQMFQLGTTFEESLQSASCDRGIVHNALRALQTNTNVDAQIVLIDEETASADMKISEGPLASIQILREALTTIPRLRFRTRNRAAHALEGLEVKAWKWRGQAILNKLSGSLDTLYPHEILDLLQEYATFRAHHHPALKTDPGVELDFVRVIILSLMDRIVTTAQVNAHRATSDIQSLKIIQYAVECLERVATICTSLKLNHPSILTKFEISMKALRVFRSLYSEE